VVRPGAEVMITCDLETQDLACTTALAIAVKAQGGRPVVLAIDAQDPDLASMTSLVAALRRAETWIDLSNVIIYSQLLADPELANTRYFVLPGLYSDLLARAIGRPDLDELERFSASLAARLVPGTPVHAKDRHGSDFRFVVAEHAAEPNLWLMPGQLNLGVAEGSAEGTVVVNGALYPPAELGRLDAPLTMQFRGGRLCEVAGPAAARFGAWLDQRSRPDRRVLMHFSFGFNPGIGATTGVIVEDERVWGALVLGLGHYSEGFHSDAVWVGASLDAGTTPILQEGEYVPPLAEIVSCRRIEDQ